MESKKFTQFIQDLRQTFYPEEIIKNYPQLNSLEKDQFYQATAVFIEPCYEIFINKLSVLKNINSHELSSIEKQENYYFLIIKLLENKTISENKLEAYEDYLNYFLSVIDKKWINEIKEHGKSLLMHVLQNESYWAWRILIKHGMDVSSCWGKSSILYALRTTNPYKNIEQLLTHGYKKSTAIHLWNEVFYMICKKSCVNDENVLLLLKNWGYHPTKQKILGKSLLHHLFETKRYDLMGFFTQDMITNELSIEGDSPASTAINSKNYQWLLLFANQNIGWKEKFENNKNAFDIIYEKITNYDNLSDDDLVDFLKEDFLSLVKSFSHEMEEFIENKKSWDISYDLLRSNDYSKFYDYTNIIPIENTYEKHFDYVNHCLFNNYYQGAIENMSENNRLLDEILIDLIAHRFWHGEISLNISDIKNYLSTTHLVYISKRVDIQDKLKNNINKYLDLIKQDKEDCLKPPLLLNQHNEYKNNVLELIFLMSQNRYRNTLFIKEWNIWLESLTDYQKMKLKKGFAKVYDSGIINKDGKNNPVTSKDIIKEENLNNSITNEFDLFTEKSKNNFINYCKDLDKNKKALSFLKKITHKDFIIKKQLAPSSKLLENIDKLYEMFPHFEKVISHIKQYMILQSKGNGAFYVPPLLMAGGAGVGKTFFSHSIAQLIQTHFEVFNMESISAGWVFKGLSDNWASAEPGRIFQILTDIEQKNLNPIFLLDEIDKARGSENYPVANTLLPLLEGYTAKNFKDECIPLEIDASHINWFATANNLENISQPIKTRFEIFNISSPTAEQRKSLIKGIYLSILKNNTWGHWFNQQIPDDTLDILSNIMAPGAARDIRKTIATACSKAILEDKNEILPSHISQLISYDKKPWDMTKEKS